MKSTIHMAALTCAVSYLRIIVVAIMAIRCPRKIDSQMVDKFRTSALEMGKLHMLIKKITSTTKN